MTPKFSLAMRCAMMGSKWWQGLFRPLPPFRPQFFYISPTADVLPPTKTSAYGHIFFNKRWSYTPPGNISIVGVFKKKSRGPYEAIDTSYGPLWQNLLYFKNPWSQKVRIQKSNFFKSEFLLNKNGIFKVFGYKILYFDKFWEKNGWKQWIFSIFRWLEKNVLFFQNFRQIFAIFMPIFTGKTSANTHKKMQVTSAVVSRYLKYKQNQNFENMFFLVRLQRTTFVSKPTLRNDSFFEYLFNFFELSKT
jgi:hypothetical protein